MNAIDLKLKIDKHIDNIAQTIAFSYGENFRDIIIKRVKNILYYVYDNDDYKIDRLENTDLFDIALEFARDLTWNLEVDEQTKRQTEANIAKVIHKSYDIGISSALIRRVILNDPILSRNAQENIEKLSQIISYYKDDYKVKEIIETLYETKNRRKLLDESILSIKKNVFKKVLNVTIDEEKVEYLWYLVEAFIPFSSELANDHFYSELLANQQKEFYEIIGCVGDTLPELLENAAKKNLIVTDEKYYELKKEYTKLFNITLKRYFSETTNINEIVSDLKDNGYNCDLSFISIFLAEYKNISGVNFACSDAQEKEVNFIVYANNSQAYTQDFVNTLIHEIMHAMGGINKLLNKKGLHYNDDIRFLHLEEAYVSYFANIISEQYIKEYGSIINDTVLESITYKYDRTSKYFQEVWKLYAKELQQIHVSDEMSYQQALQLCPILDIANALTNIMNADPSEVDDISKVEIEKLIRRAKR